jgi:hypothetical protein
MLMVIFGAGASYDSSPDLPPSMRAPWRPPLAAGLFLDPNGDFGDIVQRYRKLLPIVSRLRKPSNGNVEEELESLQDDAHGDPERKRQLFSVRYYLHDLLLNVSTQWLKRTNHVTNYCGLIDQIRHLDPTGVCLVTFNYDLLLDDALLSFGYAKPQTLENQFDAHRVFKLFKPHGSADWARLVDAPQDTRLQPELLIERADSIKLSDKYVFANATDPHQIFNFESPIVPAIAVPVQTKTEDTFEWPQSHRAYLEQLLPSVRKILIIGWQAKEAHFMQMLRDKLPRGGREVAHIMVVGKGAEDSKEILHRFAAELGQSGYHSNHHYTDGGFSKFVAERKAGAFLRGPMPLTPRPDQWQR